MQYVKLFAGLGNQLFQYSYGVFLRARGERVKFLLSTSPGCLTDVFDIKDEELFQSSETLALFAWKAWAKFIARSYRVGFFQECRYARAAVEREAFIFRRQGEYEGSPWMHRIRKTISVSVHIRGGDYLGAGAAEVYGGICDRSYYEDAFTRLSSLLNDPTYFVFTNDPEYARSILAGCAQEYHIVDGDPFSTDPGFDLFLMTRCRAHIVSNSTFAWWGAFLGEGGGANTVCPDRWTNHGGSEELSRLVPPEWIKVPKRAI